MNPSDKSETEDAEESNEDNRIQLPSFRTRPLASSTQCLSSSVDVLKSFLSQDESRRPFSRSGGGELFLKPLPASGYYGRPILSSAYHGGGYPFPCFYGNCFQPFDHMFQSQLYRCRSEPSAVGQGNKIDSNLSPDSDKDEKSGILKKPKSPEGVKDIVINNSLVFIPNLNDLGSNADSKGISDLSTKLIEDFNKLKIGMKDESKEAKMVQFDLGAGSPVKDSLDNSFKSREPFSSLSTNDSLPFLPTNTNSPTSTSGRMEWDSAADVGYVSVDMSKEKLSTLERVTLQGMARQGNSEKKVVYKKTSRGDRILQRIPSDLIEIEEKKQPVMKETGTNPEVEETRRTTSDNNTQTTDEPTLSPETTVPKKIKKTKKPEKKVKNSIEDEELPPLPEMKDQSTLVNTLDDDLVLRKLSSSSEEKPSSPRVKKLTKKKSHDGSQRSHKIQQILEIARAIEITPECRNDPKSPPQEVKPSSPLERRFESKGVQVKSSPKLMSSKNVQASGELNSLPKHLENLKMEESSGGARTKSTQFFGQGVHSLPRGLEHVERQSKKPEKSKLTKKAVESRSKPPDRAIVREKFFQSQMVSRSTEVGRSLVGVKSAGTSMTRPENNSTLEFENVPQSTMVATRSPEMVTVGVQYSPKAEPEERRHHRDAWTDTIDSQASSTQTAHSWVHGGVPARESVVRPTRSFEYLPGDVYENSNNIREVLPSETSQNVITESESSAESMERPNNASDSEGGGKHSNGTVVLDDTGVPPTGAWLLVKGDAVDIIRKDNKSVSEISGKFTSGSDKEQESVARLEKCSAGVQTDEGVEKINQGLVEALADALRAVLNEKRSEKSEPLGQAADGSTSPSSEIFLECMKRLSARKSQPSTRTSTSTSMKNSTKYSASLPPTPRLEYVSVETQSEHNPINHQATQMSQRNPFKDTSTQMGSTLGRSTQRSRHDQATQMSNRGSEKSTPLTSGSSHKAEKSIPLASGSKESPVCNDCKKSACVCGDAKNSSSSRRMLKTINGEVFRTYLDVDFSETVSSSSTSVDKSKNSEKDKENIQCSVCRCRFKNDQDCVFCPCHIDKKMHIPRCDCHDKIPRYLIPGFCKCHKRNLRHVNQCKCAEQNNVENNKCPCCEYFAARMRSQLLAAQIGAIKTPKKSEEPPLPAKNYFLKLEETEVSKDSSDVSTTGQKPLEVVTIKIPVKRMGKAKVPCKQFYYSGEVLRSKNDEIEFLDDIVRKYRGLVSSRQQQSVQSYPKGSTSERASVGTFSSYRTLQECLESNRPDFLNSAEYRRQVINERARQREQRRNESEKLHPRVPVPPQVPKRIFTTAELHQQNRKQYKKLPEVAQKKEDEKKRELYRTNKLMAEIYAKKLQLKTLRGELNFSNSCDMLTT